NLSIPIASRKKATLGAMSERPCYLQILCRPPFGANSLRGNAPGGKVTTGPVIPPLSAAVAAAIPYCPARSSVGAHASPLMRLVRRAARPRLPSGRGTGQGRRRRNNAARSPSSPSLAGASTRTAHNWPCHPHTRATLPFPARQREPHL